MNCVSRPVAPVGVTSTAAPCCSLKMRSGWIIAEPFAPTMSNQKRSPSPRWRQLTSTVSDTPFSHTISADPMSSTASLPGLVKCAEMRLGVGQPASHIPRSMSGRPRSSTAPPPPPQHLPARLKRVPAAPHRLQCPEVTAGEKPAHRLHVGAEAMVHAHHHPLAVLVARREGTLDAGKRQRERPLAQHVDAGRERRRDVDLVQMIGCADDDDVDIGVAEDLFDVVVGVLNLEAGGEGLCFADIIVADRHYLDAGEPPEHRQMRDLRDRASAKHADPNGLVHLLLLPPGPRSRPPGSRYMTPVRRLTDLSPLDSTPRPSTVKRHAGERLNSNPIVPFNPAVITSRASSMNVPLIAAPLPLRT